MQWCMVLGTNWSLLQCIFSYLFPLRTTYLCRFCRCHMHAYMLSKWRLFSYMYSTLNTNNAITRQVISSTLFLSYAFMCTSISIHFIFWFFFSCLVRALPHRTHSISILTVKCYFCTKENIHLAFGSVWGADALVCIGFES